MSGCEAVEGTKTRVRVLLVSKAMLGVTAQKKADLLARQAGVDLTVASPAFWRADDGGKQMLEDAERPGWRLEVVPIWMNGSFHTYTFPTIGRLMRELRPDVVHMDEEPYNLATYLVVRAARRVGARSLFVTWQNLDRSYPFPFSAMEQYNYRHSQFALAANADAVQVIRRKGYRGPVAVFPQFGVDVELFVPRPRPTDRRVRIGYVGRLVEQKNVDALVRAFAPLAGQAELIITGRGPCEESLRALAAELGIGERTQFVGSLESAAVAPAMADLDVLVLPSRTTPNWVEQFGRVLVEAMACEVAVVGSSSGEIPHVIDEPDLVFPEGDVAALSAILRQLVDHPDQRAGYARRGRARALALYTQQHIADATYAAWAAMMTAGTARAAPVA
jgi:glycosyltransferase involved in cell wall biosynthesis